MAVLVCALVGVGAFLLLQPDDEAAPPRAISYVSATSAYNAMLDGGVGCEGPERTTYHYASVGDVDAVVCTQPGSGSDLTVAIFQTDRPSRELLDDLTEHLVVGPNWVVSITGEDQVDDVLRAMGGDLVTDRSAYPERPSGGTTTTEATTPSTRRSTTTTQTVATGRCPSVPEEVTGTRLFVRDRYETERFTIWICQDSDGDLTYYGRLQGGDPETDSITVPARLSGGTYVASNASVTYRIDSEALVVVDASGKTTLEEPVVRHDSG